MTLSATAPYGAPVGSRPFQTVRHIGAMTKRNLMRYLRTPQLVVFSSIQPIMFVLLFGFVFGGAISTPGINYIDYLIPGILAQTAIFGASMTAVGLTTDLQAGIVDRFRSLPMARSAVLAGRTFADLSRTVFTTALMIGVGALIGFRFHSGAGDALLAMVVVLLFGYAMSWLMATVGLVAKTPETAQTASFLPIFPLVFASSAFVPVATMPEWLQGFAENQPVSVIVNTVRALVLGLPADDLIWRSFVWIAALLLVFVPLSVRLYRRAGE